MILVGSLLLPIPGCAVSSVRASPQAPSWPVPSTEEADPAEFRPDDDSDECCDDEEPALEPVWIDPRLTAGGALQLFMSSRNYRTIRALKASMTPKLIERYDRNSAPFNGKRRIRIVAFEFREAGMKPVKPGKGSTQIKTYNVNVRSLWAEQAEAVELRTEAVRVLLQEDGTWRVGRLSEVSSQPMRYMEFSDGIATLRLLMRAWQRRNLESAREHMSPRFLKSFEGHVEALEEFIVGPANPRHAAYEVLEVEDEAPDRIVARLNLYMTSPGQPWPLEANAATVTLVREGPYWHLDNWE